MPKGVIKSINVKGFRSLAEVAVPLKPLTVLVGPNGSGKTNVLNVLRFLASTIRFDLTTAIELFGGYERLLRDDGESRAIKITIEAVVTEHAHDNARDRYSLTLRQRRRSAIHRSEDFTFKRVSGPGRRITVNGSTVTIKTVDPRSKGRQLELADEQTAGLSILPKLAPGQGGEGIDDFAKFISSIQVLEPNVTEARAASRLYGSPLAEDASNLADALLRLREQEPQAFRDVQRDLSRCLPGVDQIGFATEGGSARSVVAQLIESGLANPIDLADASFGTVRLLSMLVALHDPNPPPFVAIEEVDHGLHPYAIDVLVDALRTASERTQVLVTTHSPTLVNRLEPDELVVCDRDHDSGASLIPAVDVRGLAHAAEASELRLGELWFSGAVGGVPE
jgi:predicted ATPase